MTQYLLGKDSDMKKKKLASIVYIKLFHFLYQSGLSNNNKKNLNWKNLSRKHIF